ncbi:MAG: glycosyltransferase family 4 protein [Fischerella sp.]|nr:glycosyltransferase family 4 protein [Fischerella sp.]
MSNHIVITYHYSLNYPGGGTRSCLEIADALYKLGHKVILVPVSSNAEQEPQSNSFQVIPAKPNKLRLHYLLDCILVAKTVKKILLEKQVDAVLSWSHEGALLPRLLKSQNVVFGMIAAHPSYIEWLNRKTDFKAIKHLTDKWFRWRPFKCADIVFVSSKYTQEEISTLFNVEKERIKITGRGINPIFSKVERSRTQTISNFIFYGSFAPAKGVFDAIAALGKVAAQGYTNWTLKLAGWGYEEEIKQSIGEHGIQNKVVLLGQLQPHELVRELEWANLAILPSRLESFGRAISEAQAAGLAVISYETGSIPEILEDGVTGWLVPVKRVDLLADAIVKAIENPEQTFHMGMVGRDRVTQRFTWERTAMAILEGIETAKQKSDRTKNTNLTKIWNNTIRNYSHK